MPPHKCPVCRTRLVIHPSSRTCSHHCAATWRTWSYEMQSKALSGDDPEELIDLEESSSISQKKLDKIFGSNK